MSTDDVLLERAVSYAVSAVDTVTPDLLSRSTPCSAWDLRMLLRHGCESVAALHEGLTTGRVALYPTVDDDTTADPTQVLRARVTRLIEDWTAVSAAPAIRIADHLIPRSLMTGAAALEIAVHGWDIAQASGDNRPIPSDLAVDLLGMSQLLVPHGNRHRLFAPSVPTPSSAGPGEKLLAYLGRPRPPGSLRP
jgi:uncharacterized protein (TIGR03086 family)